VKKGGKLFVEGLTGFYDENMFSLFNTGFPLQDVFGGTIREIKCIPGDFEMTVKYPLIAHLWKGYIYDTGGEVLSTENEYVTATRNRFGKGETVWIPSMMGLGARRNGNGEDLSKLLLGELNPQVPVRFDQYEKGLFMQTMDNGQSYLSVVINKSGEKKDVKIHAPGLKARIVFPDNAGKITDNQLTIHPEETIVLEWR
jgi:beta-galactosidase